MIITDLQHIPTCGSGLLAAITKCISSAGALSHMVFDYSMRLA